MLNNVNCHNCTEQMKIVRGCNGNINKVIEGIVIDKCPVKMFTSQVWLYIESYLHYKNGFLFQEGGWIQQPAKVTSAIDFISNIIGQQEKKEKNGKTRFKH